MEHMELKAELEMRIRVTKRVRALSRFAAAWRLTRSSGTWIIVHYSRHHLSSTSSRLSITHSLAQRPCKPTALRKSQLWTLW